MCVCCVRLSVCRFVLQAELLPSRFLQHVDPQQQVGLAFRFSIVVGLTKCFTHSQTHNINNITSNLFMLFRFIN